MCYRQILGLKVVIFDDYFSLMYFFLDVKGKMSDIKSWRSEQEESQSASVKSADSIPDVQDPLGSLVMTPEDR